MKDTGRKNQAGGWLRGELLSRLLSAGMLAMAIMGFGLGFIIRGFPVFDRLDGNLAAGGMIGVMLLTVGALYLFCRRIDSTWGRGLDAERQVGDLIEHAVAQRGCAFAHDVTGALGGPGNVDHVVMTFAGVWVVETKSGWLSKRRFPSALRQVAENVRRVRRHLETSLPVRGALLVAGRRDGSLEVDHDWDGEPVKVFDPKTFWRLLRREREPDPAIGQSLETARVERMVWNLGSTRYSDL